MCPAFRSQPIEFNGLAPESFALARLSAHMTRGRDCCDTPKSACARRLCESREQKFGAPRVTRTAPWIKQVNAKACIETAFRVLTSMDFNYFCKIRPVLIRARERVESSSLRFPWNVLEFNSRCSTNSKMPLVAVARSVAMSSDVLIGIPSIIGSAAVQWVNVPINSDKRARASRIKAADGSYHSGSTNCISLLVLIISSAEHQRARHLHHVARRSAAMMW